jgi:hypothetical protein
MTAVDIVVPCYNYAHYLETCVASLLGQAGVDLRVLVIDDCSSDDTPAVAARLAAKDPRVSVRRNPVNLGLIGTANLGLLQWATAPYVLLISADDALTPGSLARATAVLEQRPEVGLVFGPVVVFEDDPPPPQPSGPHDDDYRVIDGPTLIEHLCHHCNDVPTPTAVVRTELQKRVGGYNPATPHSGDMEMWLRLAAHAKVGVIHAPQGYYRVHGANMSRAYFAQPTLDAQQRLTAAKEAFAAVGGYVPEFPRILRTMRRIEARRAYWRAELAFEAGERSLGETFLTFATETDPSPLLARGFWNAVLKRRLDPRVLRWLRRLTRRGAPPSATKTRQLQLDIDLVPGQLWGWWPDAQTNTR